MSVKKCRCSIRKSEEKFRTYIENSPIAVFVAGKSGKYIDVNPVACKMLGYSREELLQMSIQNAVHDEDLDKVLADFKLLTKNGELNKEYKLKRKDGKIIPVCLTAAKISESSYIGFCNDISTQKQAEETLRESEERYRMLVNNIKLGITLIDTDHNIVMANPVLEKLLKKDVHELIGKKCYREYEKRENICSHCPGVKAMATGLAQEVEIEQILDDGSRISVHNRAFPTFGPEGKVMGFIEIVADITKRKRVEEALKSRQSEVEGLNANLEERVQEELKLSRNKDFIMIHQARLAAMGEMIGNIAHQWKQPLNALNILLYNIKDFFDEHELKEENIDNFIGKGIELIMKMSSTIDDFRNFFKPDKEKEEFSVNEIARDSLSLINASFKYHNISVELNERDKIRVVGFPNEYSQVILNILNNAKDAIIAREIDGKVKLDIFQERNSVVVTIKDNGGGIPEKILTKIFNPYFTTKEGSKGTGIGLYMSKVIIEEHMNGYLDVRNIEDGAEFKITTPIVQSGL